MTETKAAAFERRVYYPEFPGGGSRPHHREPYRETPGLVRIQKEPRESMGTILYYLGGGKLLPVDRHPLLGRN